MNINIATMPWGDHKGKPISSLPTQYLEWLIKAKCFNALRLVTQEQVKIELKNREVN